MTLVVAAAVADGQVFQMAAATLAQGLDVLKRGVCRQHMLAAHPAGHHPMQLACNRLVNFVSGESEFAHGVEHTAWAAVHNAGTPETSKTAP